MFEKEMKSIMDRLPEFSDEAIQEGKDLCVVLTYKNDLILKSGIDISKYDTVFGKIVLTWNDSKLDFKYINYEPYKVHKKIKFVNDIIACEQQI